MKGTRLKVENSSHSENIKLVGALGLSLGGLLAFYYLGNSTQLVRVLALLSLNIAALVTFSMTLKGQEVFGFLKEAQSEVKKVVWPNRQETVQTTLFVLVVVVIFAILLWLLDLLLSSVVKTII